MKKSIKNFLNDESGATAIEYGLLAALIALVLIASVTKVGKQLETNFSTMETKLKAANPI